MAQFPNTLISQRPVSVYKNAGSEDQSLITTGNYQSLISKKNKAVYMVFTQFEKYKLGEKNGTSSIMFSGSSFQKDQQEATVYLSKHRGGYFDGDSILVASEPCIGPSGEIYICWGGPSGLAFQRSMDNGKTWLPEEKIICALRKGWRITEKNGCVFKKVPAMTCVEGNNPYKGRIYSVWSDARNGGKNEDVFMVYSDDKGDTWTEPIILTYRPNHKAQFQPMIEADSTDGSLYVMYYDQQNFPKGDFADVYLSIGKEGSSKFEHYRLNEIPVPINEYSNPRLHLKQTEYIFIPGSAMVTQESVEIDSTDLDKVQTRSALDMNWLFTDENHIENSIHATVNDSLIKNYNKKYPEGEIEINRSFPFSERTEIKFYSPWETIINAMLTKPLEPGFEALVTKDKLVKKGYTTLTINAEELNLKRGNYILTLYYNHRNTYVWITEE
jgi:hypothetical protein